MIEELGREVPGQAETFEWTDGAGDRVRVAIVRVAKAAKGPQVIVSRTDPALLVKLFEIGIMVIGAIGFVRSNLTRWLT